MQDDDGASHTPTLVCQLTLGTSHSAVNLPGAPDLLPSHHSTLCRCRSGFRGRESVAALTRTPRRTTVAGMQEPSTGDAPTDGFAVAGIRKLVLYREVVLSEGGTDLAEPVNRATVAAVIANPWLSLGTDADLSGATKVIAPILAKLLTDRLAETLGGVDRIEAFGKAAVVGTAGEIEHAGALIHTPFFGNLMRDFLEGESIICFADTRAEAGEALVVPMWHKSQAATRSHYQTVTTRVSDAPRADEIVVAAAASTGPRPHARIGDRATDPVVTAENLTQYLESALS